MKVEYWNGHPIRFVEKDGEWWAVAKDAADALNFRDANVATRKMKPKYKGTFKVRTTSEKAKAPETQEMTVLNEKGLYRLIMRSNKPEAEDFQDWVYEMLKTLRQSTGLEGFQVFRMLDKEHQKEAMQSHMYPQQLSIIVSSITVRCVENITRIQVVMMRVLRWKAEMWHVRRILRASVA